VFGSLKLMEEGVQVAGGSVLAAVGILTVLVVVVMC
jgi:hypothetical protein